MGSGACNRPDNIRDGGMKDMEGVWCSGGECWMFMLDYLKVYFLSGFYYKENIEFYDHKSSQCA